MKNARMTIFVTSLVLLFGIGVNVHALIIEQMPTFEFEHYNEGDLDWADSADESFTGSTALGFSVTIGGAAYSYFNMSSNGYIELLTDIGDTPTGYGPGPINGLTNASSATYLLAAYDDLSSREYGYYGYKLFSDRAVFYYDTETWMDEWFNLLNNFEVVLYDDGNVQWNFNYANYFAEAGFGYSYDLFSGLYLGNTQTLLELYSDHIPEEESHITPEPTTSTTLTILSEPNYMTIVPPTGEHVYIVNQTINLQAVPFIYCPDTYILDYWEGDVAEPNQASTTILMDSDKTVTAVFTPTRKCGDACHPNFLLGDLNHDCIIDLADLAMLESRWLTCTKPECDDGDDGDDIVPPLPDPMTWLIPPHIIQDPPGSGLYYIEMTAATAVDPVLAGYDGGYGVQYRFECLQDGSKSSGWIDPAIPPFPPGYYRVQVDDASDNYEFRVQARDMSPSQNETGWSCYCYSGSPLTCFNNPPLCD